MINSEKNTKKKQQKNFRQRDNDQQHGKIRYRIRKELEKEGTKLVGEFKKDG